MSFEKGGGLRNITSLPGPEHELVGKLSRKQFVLGPLRSNGKNTRTWFGKMGAFLGAISTTKVTDYNSSNAIDLMRAMGNAIAKLNAIPPWYSHSLTRIIKWS